MHEKQQEDEIKEVMRDLEKKKPSDEGADALVTRLYEYFMTHSSEIETSVIPALQDTMTPSEIKHNTDLWNQGVGPSLSDKAQSIGDKISQAASAAVDKVRQMASGDKVSEKR